MGSAHWTKWCSWLRMPMGEKSHLTKNAKTSKAEGRQHLFSHSGYVSMAADSLLWKIEVCAKTIKICPEWCWMKTWQTRNWHGIYWGYSRKIPERRICCKGLRKNNLADLDEIWSIWLSKTAGIAGYFKGFANEYRPKISCWILFSRRTGRYYSVRPW